MKDLVRLLRKGGDLPDEWDMYVLMEGVDLEVVERVASRHGCMWGLANTYPVTSEYLFPLLPEGCVAYIRGMTDDIADELREELANARERS